MGGGALGAGFSWSSGHGCADAGANACGYCDSGSLAGGWTGAESSGSISVPLSCGSGCTLGRAVVRYRNCNPDTGRICGSCANSAYGGDCVTLSLDGREVARTYTGTIAQVAVDFTNNQVLSIADACGNAVYGL